MYKKNSILLDPKYENSCTVGYYWNIQEFFSRENDLFIPFHKQIVSFSGRFKIQRQKESTGRVVFWNMGITYSYTCEASYGGTNMGSRAFTHFNTDDYEGIGR